MTRETLGLPTMSERRKKKRGGQEEKRKRQEKGGGEGREKERKILWLSKNLRH